MARRQGFFRKAVDHPLTGQFWSAEPLRRCGSVVSFRFNDISQHLLANFAFINLGVFAALREFVLSDQTLNSLFQRRRTTTIRISREGTKLRGWGVAHAKPRSRQDAQKRGWGAVLVTEGTLPIVWNHQQQIPHVFL
jgi:hypothetical protein